MYKISVPIMNKMVNQWGGERMLEEIRRLDAERVFLAINLLDPNSPEGREQIETLRTNTAFFHAHGLEVGAWSWAFSLPQNSNYQPVVNAYGAVSSEMVCPTDEKWRDFVASFVEALATCDLDIIQFDDDYRFGYHDIGFGCLCPNHIKMMEEFLGETIDFEKLPDALLSGGPNKYRDAFLKANGKSLEDFASCMRRHLDRVNPNVRMGYCTCLTNWDIDGTSPDEISRRYAGNTKPFYRLIGAPYWAALRTWGNDHLGYIVELERMEKSWNQDENIEIFSEGDVYPRPRFRVPAAYMEGFDTGLRVAGTLDGILKYGTDYYATPGYESGYQLRHERNRNLYTQIATLFDGKKSVGMRCYEAPAKYAKMNVPPKMQGKLDLQDCFFGFSARMLADCSLPTIYEGVGCGGVCFGANAEFLSKEALSHGLILDVEAARILASRGIDVGVQEFGEFQKIRNEVWPSSGPLYCDEDWARELTLKPGAIIESSYESPRKMPASFRYENAHGQKFLIFAFEGIFASHGLFRQYTRAKQVEEAAKWFGTPFPAVCEGNPFLYIQEKTAEDGTLSIGLWNFCEDDIPDPIITTEKTYRIKSTIQCTATQKDHQIYLSRMEPWSFAAIELEPLNS